MHTVSLQLNRYETAPYFLQFSKSITTVSLIIHVFCKSCELEIVSVLICTLAEQFHVHNSYKHVNQHCCVLEFFLENIDVVYGYLAINASFNLRIFPTLRKDLEYE